jgi:N-carbamoyl-L-amino-acid hydrolase
MGMRNDALVAAAQFVLAVNEETLKVPGNQVGTVGSISALPGAPNVIPGEVQLSLEIRDLSSDKILRLFRSMQKRAENIAAEKGVEFIFTPIDVTSAPALTNPGIQGLIGEAAAELGLSTKKMQSGAGHDAQEMAHISPVGMIFVPSQNGISHSPKEYTTPEDMANGANVLLRTILKIDQTW